VKKLVCVLLGLALAAGAAWAQAYDIDVKKLPADSAYQKHIAEFLPLQKLVAAWMPEWQAAIPKAKVIGVIQQLLKETKDFVSKDASGNVDLLLFQALLKTCLYNADLTVYHDEIVKDLTSIKKQFPKDYRAYWMLANHYGSADDTFAAYNEYDTMFTTVSDGKPIPDVMDDYLMVCFYSMIYSRCKSLMDETAKANRTSDPRTLFPLYGPVSALLKDPPPRHAFPNDQVYQQQRRQFEAGYLNRVLGIWIPLKDTWKVAAFELTAEAFTSFSVLMPRLSTAGKDIANGLTIYFQGRTEEPFDKWVDKVTSKFDKKQITQELKCRWPAIVYEFRDPTTYTANGGGHGYVVFVKRGQPEIAGLAIEAPATFPFPKNGNKVNTVIITEGYTRYAGDMYYAFVFNAADENFTAAKKEFFEFMNRVLLD
jgi:hypothetical protein